MSHYKNANILKIIRKNDFKNKNKELSHWPYFHACDLWMFIENKVKMFHPDKGFLYFEIIAKKLNDLKERNQQSIDIFINQIKKKINIEI